MTAANTGPGLGSAILVAALLTFALGGLAVITRMLANGMLGPNALVGIRLRPLLASDEAWQRGHAAAARPLTIAAILGFLSLVGSVVTSHQVLPYLFFLGLALGIMIVGVIVAAVVAVRAAKRG